MKIRLIIITEGKRTIEDYSLVKLTHNLSEEDESRILFKIEQAVNSRVDTDEKIDDNIRMHINA